MKKVKIRIVKAPNMAYGGQSGFGLDLNSRRSYVEGNDGPQDSYGRTLAPIDREDATYEAERGEVIVGDMDRDGRQEMLTFGGKPHSQGGTPSNQEGFIFSKTKNMSLRGPIVEKFGKKAGSRYTPADLAKQYDLTKYKAVLDDPTADELSKKTAQLMYDNYESKLADLAMVQESMKGFPQGVPEMAAKKYGGAPMGTEVEAGPMAAYGGMYKMQQAGQAPKREPVYDKEELELLKGLRDDKYTINMPVNAAAADADRFTLPEIQTSRNKRRVYGDEDWTDPALMADFKKRQSFFTDNAPTWDPTIPGATLAFQQAYDAERKKLGLKSYFDKGKKFQSKDDKFGEYTYSAPGLYNQQPVAVSTPAPSQPAAPAPRTPEKKITLDEYQMQQGVDPRFSSPSGNRLPYNRFDVANLLSAASTPVKSYAPRMFQPDVQEMQGYYDQPDYNPLLAAANTRMQMNNTFGNASAAMAANSYNPELSQALIQETQRARSNNLQTANNFSQANAQIRNQSNMMNAQLAQDNYDKFVRTQEQTDIANKLKFRKDIMPAAQNMVNNRVNMEKFNALYPQYQVTGNDWRVNFEGGKNYGERAAMTTGANYGLREFFAENPDLKSIYERGDDAKKLEIAKMVAARQREYRSMMGRSPRNISGNMNNPFFPSMMGMPQVGPNASMDDESDLGY